MKEEIEETAVELEKKRKNKCYKKIRDWRKKFGDVNECYKWAKGVTPFVGYEIHDEETKEPAQCLQDALDMATKYWRTVWDGQRAEDATIEEMKEILGSKRNAEDWKNISEEDMSTALRRQNGKAAGLDGWAGDELARTPKKAVQRMIAITNYCIEKGAAPRS